MKKLFFLAIFILASCTPQVTAAPTVTVTRTAAVPVTVTSAPTATPTAPPTPISYTPEAWVGMDVIAMSNARLDALGLHLTMDSGEVIFTSDQLSKQAYLGQDNVYQIRDEDNKNVLFAYDKETNTFLDASKYIQKDNSDPEKYIQVANWEELKALWAKEKMFMIPFDPDKTYFPELDKIYLDYENWSESSLNEYSYTNPFGHLPRGMDEPFEFVNFVRMARDKTMIGSVDTYLVSQQTFNPDDKSFSVLHPAYPNLPYNLQALQELSTEGKYQLPT